MCFFLRVLPLTKTNELSTWRRVGKPNYPVPWFNISLTWENLRRNPDLHAYRQVNNGMNHMTAQFRFKFAPNSRIYRREKKSSTLKCQFKRILQIKNYTVADDLLVFVPLTQFDSHWTVSSVTLVTTFAMFLNLD